MKVDKKGLLAGGMVAAAALAGTAGTALAVGPETGAAVDGGATLRVDAGAGAFFPVHADAAAGTFSFDQSTLTPNAQIATTFRSATKALCSATDDFAQANPLEWELAVTGDVDEAFRASVDELANESSVKQTMTCTCGGNPADGRAIVTAEVKGIPVSHLLDRAQARAGANTLVFVAADGTEVEMPLSYAVARHAVISYEVNDEDLSASMGGNNQLWLAGAGANSFVRDVVEVRVEARDAADVPAEPGKGADYPNSPNVGVLDVQVG